MSGAAGTAHRLERACFGGRRLGFLQPLRRGRSGAEADCARHGWQRRGWHLQRALSQRPYVRVQRLSSVRGALAACTALTRSLKAACRTVLQLLRLMRGRVTAALRAICSALLPTGITTDSKRHGAESTSGGHAARKAASQRSGSAASSAETFAPFAALDSLPCSATASSDGQ